MISAPRTGWSTGTSTPVPRRAAAQGQGRAGAAWELISGARRPGRASRSRPSAGSRPSWAACGSSSSSATPSSGREPVTARSSSSRASRGSASRGCCYEFRAARRATPRGVEGHCMSFGRVDRLPPARSISSSAASGSRRAMPTRPRSSTKIERAVLRSARTSGRSSRTCGICSRSIRATPPSAPWIPAQRRGEIFGAAAPADHAGGRGPPQVCVFEDLHWMDRPPRSTCSRSPTASPRAGCS